MVVKLPINLLMLFAPITVSKSHVSKQKNCDNTTEFLYDRNKCYLILGDFISCSLQIINGRGH